MDDDKQRLPGEPEDQERSKDLPPIGKAVWVQCESYRTMAYRDKHGKWRCLADDKELQGTVKVVESG